jgi:hypothetical protein
MIRVRGVARTGRKERNSGPILGLAAAVYLLARARRNELAITKDAVASVNALGGRCRDLPRP